MKRWFYGCSRTALLHVYDVDDAVTRAAYTSNIRCDDKAPLATVGTTATTVTVALENASMTVTADNYCTYYLSTATVRRRIRYDVHNFVERPSRCVRL